MPGTPVYRGRFAPSPTGPLHFGSLVAALASYLDARHAGGQWLLRIEDLDPPREEQGAAQHIIDSLRRHGLNWDGEVMWQGQRSDAYGAARQQLAAAGHLFNCDCTRATLGPDGCCAGRCAGRQRQLATPCAVRVAVPGDCRILFPDGIQGEQDVALGRLFPDFVVRRKDGLDAYQLAVVVDDADQGITHVVRGSDLLDSTPRQIYLQRLLGLPRPTYSHLPVITGDDGGKLSKQNHAPALDDSQALRNLRRALQHLGQATPPPTLDTVAALLDFATRHWSLAGVPAVPCIREDLAIR